MNERELRAYAHRGLKARLAELDEERARILILLSLWADTPEGAVSRKRAETRLQRVETVPAVVAALAEGVDFGAPRHDADIDVARVLPRRRRLVAPVTIDAAPAPALPPMPRLVKARAS